MEEQVMDEDIRAAFEAAAREVGQMVLRLDVQGLADEHRRDNCRHVHRPDRLSGMEGLPPVQEGGAIMETEENIKMQIIELRAEIGGHRDEIDRHRCVIEKYAVAIEHLRDALRRQRVLATIEEVLLTNETEWSAEYRPRQWHEAILMEADEAKDAAGIDDMAARRKIARIAACAASWMLAIDLARESPGDALESQS